MDSHDRQVQIESTAGSQQTRLSGFFRNVHLKFRGLSQALTKKDPDPAVEDVVITAQVLRKKPQLVIGNVSNILATPPPPPPEVDVHSNGETFMQPNAGAGTKRKATSEVEEVMNKRRDAQMREICTFTLKPAIRNQEEGVVVQPKVSVQQVTWKQDGDWIAMNEPAFPVSDPHEDSSKLESAVEDGIIVSPTSATSSLPSNISLQDGPPCQLKEPRVDTDVGMEEGIFDALADDIDIENCTTSGNRQRKDELLGGKWSIPVDLKGDVFSCKLKEILAKPFDDKESEEMWQLASRRKPVLKLRQTRGRTMQVTTNDEGLSYLDHHPDLAQRLQQASLPSEKLALLRCFFFWLQHSCMEGAYKPWVPASKNRTEEDDCDFTDGPDCEVLAVVLPLDEKKDVSSVVKPLEPVIVDLSDDDEDDCLDVSVRSPVKEVPEPNINCHNSHKAATCNCCCTEFGMEKEQQRALYKSCGHIETCMKCVDRLWKVGKQSCLKCGAIQSVRPRSIMDFADDSD